MHHKFSFRSGLRVCAAVMFALSAAAAHADGAFTPLAGNWIGNGVIDLPSGAHERLRCRASYAVSPGGDNLSQVLRCASDSYQVNVESSVNDRDGQISGTWAETTRGASGTLTGVMRDGAIEGTIAGMGFTAVLSLVTHGRSQTVSIKLNSADIAGVRVSFRKL